MNIKLFFNKLYTKLPIILYDILAIPVAWLLAYWLRYNLSVIPFDVITKGLFPVCILITMQTLCYYYFKVYRGIWRYASIIDVVNIIKAIISSVLLTIVALFFSQTIQDIPRSVWPIYLTLLVFLLCGGRLLMRWQNEFLAVKKQNHFTKRTLIIGAGDAGISLVRSIKHDSNSRYDIVGFIDDNKSFLSQEIHGIKVLSNIDDLVNTVNKYQIELILIAIPRATSKEMRRIVNFCEQTSVPFRTLPNILDIASGKVDIKALREVKIDDLLGRDEVDLDWDSISNYIKNKKIMVTGGGGSIGSELCRQIARLQPAELCIIDNSEFNLYKIQLELLENYVNLSTSNLHVSLTNVTDRYTLNNIINQFQPNIVFHAAAYKHVPLLEDQLYQAVHNNIIGTKNVADCCIENNIAEFVLISTDKAVNPTNIMGATKRTAEIYCQNLNNLNKTKFITVRFGNVLGSAGSVVPLFKEQIERGGPITVTHPEIERYFMTIPEASRLILQAIVNGNGGEIFVLDMGEPIKIRFLAEEIIRLSGKVPYKDIDITYTGLRAGEKLYEELFYALEELVPTQHDKILMAKSRNINWQQFTILLGRLEANCHNLPNNQLRELIKSLVPEYHSEQDHTTSAHTTITEPSQLETPVEAL